METLSTISDERMIQVAAYITALQKLTHEAMEDGMLPHDVMNSIITTGIMLAHKFDGLEHYLPVSKALLRNFRDQIEHPPTIN